MNPGFSIHFVQMTISLQYIVFVLLLSIGILLSIISMVSF